MLINKWIKKNTAKLNGKRVAISGSTGGLGRELCFLLASLGASLVLVDRNIEKSHALAEEIRQRHTDVDILHIKADMADMDSVRCAADELLKMLKSEFTDINAPIVVYGPFDAPIYKSQGRYRKRIMVKCKLTSQVRGIFGKIYADMSRGGSGVFLSVDFNPTNL